MDTKTSQAGIRNESLKQRRALSDEYRTQASKKIADKVLSSALLQRAETIACYLPLKTEVDTSPLIMRALRKKKRILLPKVKKNRQLSFFELSHKTQFATNSLGILEPVSGNEFLPKEIDIVITPLVAFDSSLKRVGFGGGYYDTSFSFLKNRKHFHKPKLLGIAFDCQKTEKIDANPWDIRLFCIFTESNHYQTKAA